MLALAYLTNFDEETEEETVEEEEEAPFEFAVEAEEEEPAEFAPATSRYYGPKDELFCSLNDEEQEEFSDLFIEQKMGNFGGLPVYVLGGDNSVFLKKVFVLLGNVRKHVSSDLLGKIYDHLNK